MRLESRPIPPEADGLRDTFNAQLQGEQLESTWRDSKAKNKFKLFPFMEIPIKKQRS